MRCSAVHIFTFENPTVRFGAVLFKAIPYGAVRLGKWDRTWPHGTGKKHCEKPWNYRLVID